MTMNSKSAVRANSPGAGVSSMSILRRKSGPDASNFSATKSSRSAPSIPRLSARCPGSCPATGSSTAAPRRAWRPPRKMTAGRKRPATCSIFSSPPPCSSGNFSRGSSRNTSGALAATARPPASMPSPQRSRAGPSA
ncbi:hypothetical protein SDC9_181479 [bioreactor metagenome]|uniref:Uncharacterized protein n=1 Tax=bioreactor metagenome TaxID=1076179 RepID=A0A645H4R0_9ZZZZ